MWGLRFSAKAIAAIALAGALLTACTGGGGGGGGSSGGSGSGGSGGGSGGSGALTWTANVFAAASTYINKCATVRTGSDIEGTPFPDTPGSVAHENFWLRSWTHETYLWNTEVLDRNPNSYSDPLAYFAQMRTTATTSSGKNKDQFHFTIPTAEYLASTLSAPTASYGAEYAALSNTRPRDYRIAYNEPNSPASQIVGGLVNLPRGARILSVDGVDLVNGGTTSAEIDILNNGLFPNNAGEIHTFVIQDAGATTSRSVTLTSANLSPAAINRTNVIDSGGSKVGYIHLTTFNTYQTEADLAAAITSMKGQGISDLVLDLRYNGGGLLAIASQLGYMIAGDARTSGKTYERLQFNASAGSTNPVTGRANSPVPFYNTGLGFSLANGAHLDTLNLGRVFILTTDDTCSASESVINSLRGVNVNVVLVGSTTCGKPYGFYPADNCGETYFSIQFQGVNDKGFGDYADGFTPDNSSSAYGVRAPGCAVSDDFGHQLGDQSEGLLAAALQYRQNGTCPSTVAPLAAARVDSSGLASEALRTSRFSPIQTFLRNNRDMRLPNGQAG